MDDIERYRATYALWTVSDNVDKFQTILNDIWQLTMIYDVSEQFMTIRVNLERFRITKIGLDDEKLFETILTAAKGDLL